MDENAYVAKKALKRGADTVLDEPGPLREEFVLLVHTREAKRMIAGRQNHEDSEFKKNGHFQSPVLALSSFGKRMTKIWVASQYDDPYADWYLWRIEQAMTEAKSILNTKRSHLDELLGNLDSVKIRSSQSISPIEVSLKFANPYGYQGAFLVAEYDALICSIMTAWHIGIIDREPKRELLKSIAKLIRRSFLLATRWQFSNITRSDILAGNDVSPELKARMGNLPQEFLEMTLRAKIAPEIRHNVKTFTLPVINNSGTSNPIAVKQGKSKNKFQLPITMATDLAEAG